MASTLANLDRKLPNKINRSKAAIGVVVDIFLIAVCLPIVIVLLDVPSGMITGAIVGGTIAIVIFALNRRFFPDTYRLYIRNKADRDNGGQ